MKIKNLRLKKQLKKINQQTEIRNAALNAEVLDLKKGTEAIEERARSELGMVKRDEVFFQIVSQHPPVSASAVKPVSP